MALVRQHKEKFTLEAYSGRIRGRDGLLTRVRERMAPSAAAHINDTKKDLDEIVEEIGLKGKVDPKYMTREQVIGHAAKFHVDRTISPADYEDELYAVDNKDREREPVGAGR